MNLFLSIDENISFWNIAPLIILPSKSKTYIYNLSLIDLTHYTLWKKKHENCYWFRLLFLESNHTTHRNWYMLQYKIICFFTWNKSSNWNNNISFIFWLYRIIHTTSSHIEVLECALMTMYSIKHVLLKKSNLYHFSFFCSDWFIYAIMWFLLRRLFKRYYCI